MRCICTEYSGVDRTIRWQLCGDEVHIGARRARDELHLPELYSGAPWRAPKDVLDKIHGRWVAFVGANPSIDVTSPFPTLQDYSIRGAAQIVENFFENRFGAPARRPSGTLRERFFAQLEVAIDYALVAAGIHVESPLGNVAFVADLVPWKFKAWSDAAAERRSLITAATGYLDKMLSIVHPAVIVALGKDAARTLATGDMPESGSGLVDMGERRVGSEKVKVVGIPHPSERTGAFCASLGELARFLAEFWTR